MPINNIKLSGDLNIEETTILFNWTKKNGLLLNKINLNTLIAMYNDTDDKGAIITGETKGPNILDTLQ